LLLKRTFCIIKTVLERNRANHKVEMVSESAPAPTLKDCGPLRGQVFGREGGEGGAGG